MKVFLKILIFSWILSLIFFWHKRFSFQDKFNTNSDELKINKYNNTPNPWKMFLLNLNLLSLKNFQFSLIKDWTIIYFDAKSLLEKKIMELLESKNSDRILILNVHLKELKSIRNKLNKKIESLNNMIMKEKEKAQTKQIEKKMWDDNFKLWFQQKNANLIIKWLDKSFENWPEYTKHRILLNAWTIILKKLKNINWLIESKILLLENNSDSIVKNYSTIKWDMLRELIRLKREINKFN